MPSTPYQLTVTEERGQILSVKDSEGAIFQVVKLDAANENQARAILNALLNPVPNSST